MLRRLPLCRQDTQRGPRTRIPCVGRPSQKVRRLFEGSAQSGARQNELRVNESGPRPRLTLYELDTRRERLNACDSPEIPTDRQFEEIIPQALPPEYERIRTSHLEKPDFGIADIRGMMSAIYAANLARSSSTTGIAGQPVAEDSRRDIICHYCERAGHFNNTCPLHAKHEQQR